MNSTKPLIKLGAGLTNNNYHLSIDKGMKGPNKAIFNIIPELLDCSICVALGLRLNQIGEKIDLVSLLLIERPFNSRVFFTKTPL